jgi:hypothetical protein
MGCFPVIANHHQHKELYEADKNRERERREEKEEIEKKKNKKRKKKLKGEEENKKIFFYPAISAFVLRENRHYTIKTYFC